MGSLSCVLKLCWVCHCRAGVGAAPPTTQTPDPAVSLWARACRQDGPVAGCPVVGSQQWAAQFHQAALSLLHESPLQAAAFPALLPHRGPLSMVCSCCPGLLLEGLSKGCGSFRPHSLLHCGACLEQRQRLTVGFTSLCQPGKTRKLPKIFTSVALAPHVTAIHMYFSPSALWWPALIASQQTKGCDCSGLKRPNSSQAGVKAFLFLCLELINSAASRWLKAPVLLGPERDAESLLHSALCQPAPGHSRNWPPEALISSSLCGRSPDDTRALTLA